MEYNVADIFESLADAIGERTALVSGDTRYSYAELDERGNRFADFLRSQGVGAGDHVGIHLWNDYPYVEAMLGCFKLRAVAININYRYVADELRYMIDNADLVAIVSQRAYAPMVAEASAGLDALKTILLLEDGSGETDSGLHAFDYEESLAAASPLRDFEPRSGDDIYIVYTGGTTGMPKGVMWRHEDVFFAGLQGGAPGGEDVESPEEVAENAIEENYTISILPTAPFIHGAAQWAAWICFFSGGKLVIQNGKSFEPKRVVELLAEEAVNSLLVVGDAMAVPVLDVLNEEGADYDLEALFVVASSGAVLSPSVKMGLQDALPDCMIMNNFGATEVGHQGAAAEGEESTDGRPSFYMDETCSVLDDEGKQLVPGSGQVGRLARSGRLPLGYYKDPDKTAQRFKTYDGKRWVVPGDFATIEEDGRITVFGRGSGCINSGGEKIFPEEVEEALKGHPEVHDVLVVGIPDPKWMQKVAALVQPRPGKTPSIEELVAHCRKHIAGYKVPRQLTLVAEVERMPSGKPDYRWAKARALETAAAAQPVTAR